MSLEKDFFILATIKLLKDIRLHRTTRKQMYDDELELEKWGHQILNREDL